MKNNKKTNGLKKQKKLIIKTPKIGEGFFPLILPILGGLAGAASGIAKAVNDAKSNKAQLKEMQRHDRAIPWAWIISCII